MSTTLYRFVVEIIGSNPSARATSKATLRTKYDAMWAAQKWLVDTMIPTLPEDLRYSLVCATKEEKAA